LYLGWSVDAKPESLNSPVLDRRFLDSPDKKQIGNDYQTKDNTLTIVLVSVAVIVLVLLSISYRQRIIQIAQKLYFTTQRYLFN